MLEILAALQAYITRDLHPSLVKEIERIIADLNTELGELGNNIAENLEEFQALHDAFTTEIIRRVESINNKTGPLEVQHIALSANYTLTVNPLWPSTQPVNVVFTQDATGGRTVTLDPKIAGTLEIDPAPGAETVIQVMPRKTAGQWRIIQVVNKVVGGAVDKAVATLLAGDSLTGSAADKRAVTAVTNDLKTPGNALALAVKAYAKAEAEAVHNAPSPLAAWKRKIESISERGTASPPAVIAVFGDSISNGGGGTIVASRWPHRLAAFLGNNGEPQELSAQNSAPVSGFHLFLGGIGGSVSGNYFLDTYPAKLALVKPDIVIHVIGLNDYGASIPMATFKSNVSRAMTRIKEAAPNAIQVMVHGPGRTDVRPADKLHQWEEYGRAVQELAKAMPGTLFLNADKEFRRMGLVPEFDRSGLLGADKVHIGDAGQRILNDLIADAIGTPMIYGADESYNAGTFSGGYLTASSGATRVYATINIPARPYPRNMAVTLSTLAGSEVGSHLSIKGLLGASGNEALSGYQHGVLVGTGPQRTVHGSTAFQVPSNVSARAIVEHDNTAKYLESNWAYASFRAVLTPM